MFCHFQKKKKSKKYEVIYDKDFIEQFFHSINIFA